MAKLYEAMRASTTTRTRRLLAEYERHPGAGGAEQHTRPGAVRSADAPRVARCWRGSSANRPMPSLDTSAGELSTFLSVRDETTGPSPARRSMAWPSHALRGRSVWLGAGGRHAGSDVTENLRISGPSRV